MTSLCASPPDKLAVFRARKPVSVGKPTRSSSALLQILLQRHLPRQGLLILAQRNPKGAVDAADGNVAAALKPLSRLRYCIHRSLFALFLLL